MKRHFIEIADFSRDEILETFDIARDLKQKTRQAIEHHILQGQTLAMVFQKPSNRTRVSFEVGMYQLGGHALYLGPHEIGLGERESVADVARVLGRYCNGIMARVFGHQDVLDLAEYSPVPVINGLSDLVHPCQIMGDMLTIHEHKGKTEGWKIVYFGDGNNVANSWVNLAGSIPMTLVIAGPEGFEPDSQLLARTEQARVSDIIIETDPHKAVADADVIYTDVWASMGQEKEVEKRKEIFKHYQVNQALIETADNQCLVMHCLPAHRGEEITDEVMDGPHSVVFEQAENRLHIQKAIMVKLMKK